MTISVLTKALAFIRGSPVILPEGTGFQDKKYLKVLKQVLIYLYVINFIKYSRDVLKHD